MHKPVVVLFHRADFDGIFCREVARKFFGYNAEYWGWDYGDKVPDVRDDQEIYMLDISIDELMTHPRLVWIDHHKTAIEKYPETIRGYRIDGVAACRLVWQWFFNESGPHNIQKRVDWSLPEKEAFINHSVAFQGEPFAVTLAGEYDIWDKRDPRAQLFQHGLRSEEPNFQRLLEPDPEDGLNPYVRKLLDQGQALAYAKANENIDIITNFGFTIQFEGFCLLACNAARYNSHLFKAGLKDEHDGMLGFNWDGPKKEWRVSLYTDKPGIDLSKVAVKYGGGGHPGACGFRTDKLPFI